MAEAVHRNVFHVRSLPQLKLSLRLSFSAHSNFLILQSLCQPFSSGHLPLCLSLSLSLSLSLFCPERSELAHGQAGTLQYGYLYFVLAWEKEGGIELVWEIESGRDRSKMATNGKPPLCSWNVCQKEKKKLKCLCRRLIPGLKCSLHEKK